MVTSTVINNTWVPTQSIDRMLFAENLFSLPYLERQLVMYVTADNTSIFKMSFDISSIPVVTREQVDTKERRKKLATITPTVKAPKTAKDKALPATKAVCCLSVRGDNSEMRPIMAGKISVAQDIPKDGLQQKDVPE